MRKIKKHTMFGKTVMTADAQTLLDALQLLSSVSHHFEPEKWHAMANDIADAAVKIEIEDAQNTYRVTK